MKIVFIRQMVDIMYLKEISLSECTWILTSWIDSDKRIGEAMADR
jgi:hypothetical protein